MSRTVKIVSVLLLCLGSFTAGFLTHRADLQEWVRPLVSWATGNAAGCDLRAAYSVQSRDVARTTFRLRESSTMLAEESGLQHWRTEMGDFWAPKGTGVAFVVAEQMHRIYGEGDHRVRNGDIVLDCGANIGAFTREALNAGAAKVVAIEPVPANVLSLQRTFRQEIEQGRVIVVAKGVWNKDDVLEMNLYENSSLDSFVMNQRPEDEGGGSRKVALPLTTIDAIVNELGLRVTFIKMDIEGAEKQALEGARQTIARDKPRMALATENLPTDYETLPRIVNAFDSGYRWACGPCVVQKPLRIRPLVMYFWHQRRTDS
jgi:FkbM family methyltransferase